MADKKGSGLLMVWADVPEEKEDEFNRWYNEEHLSDLVSTPGVLKGARYEAVKSGPKHLACYELESPDVMETDAFRRFRENPSEWSKRSSPSVIGTAYIRNLYEMIYPAGLTPEISQSDTAPVLQIGRMDIPPEKEDEFNEWYNTVYVPNYEKVPGCIRGRRFRVVQGAPKYLVVYEFEHESVSESPEWLAQRDISSWTARIRPHMQHAPGSPGIWRKTFQL